MAANTRLTEAPRFHTGGFPLSHVCLWLTLDLVEQAVLAEGGGEAVAGLLRALRTPRAVGAVALAAGRRGQVEGGEVWPLVGLLEKVRCYDLHRFPEHSKGGGDHAVVADICVYFSSLPALAMSLLPQLNVGQVSMLLSGTPRRSIAPATYCTVDLSTISWLI